MTTDDQATRRRFVQGAMAGTSAPVKSRMVRTTRVQLAAAFFAEHFAGRERAAQIAVALLADIGQSCPCLRASSPALQLAA